jgi:type IV pilus assembly protein PilP
MNRITCVCFAAALLAPGVAAPSATQSAATQQPPAAQPPSSAAPSAATPSPAKPPEAPPASAPAPYKYDPAGRRDPFVSLLGRGSDPRASTAIRASGVPGLLISEVTVKGIIRDRSGFIAMIAGPDNKTYVVRAGDRLLDGSVKSIAGDAVVFSQDVNDPLSLVKQKEIRKTLRTTQEGRG